jgi:hypothetical protein
MSHKRQREKKMSKVLRTMAMVGTLGLGISNLFGAGATPQTADKQGAKPTTAAQSNAPQAAETTTGKKKATKHHHKQSHHRHSQTKGTTQPTGSATAPPNK